MSAASPAVSFDDIIARDRKKREHEALAKEIFGKNRRSSDTGQSANKKTTQTPSLASRTGIAKRSSSSTNVKLQRTNPFSGVKPPSRPSSAASQIARTNKIASVINDTHQANVLPTTQNRPLPGHGLTIRGTAGPFVVRASNFAPGTTAADIESALQSVATDSNGASGIASCKIMSNNPTVIAEMVFHEKHVAETVISTFNNQKADGRILHVFMHRSGPSAAGALHRKKSEPTELFASDPVPAAAAKETIPEENGAVDGGDDVEMAEETPYTDARQSADQERRERESRRAEPDVQDGRYGFGSRSEQANVTEPQQASVQSQEESKANDVADDRDGRSRRDDGRDRRYDNGGYPRRDDAGSYRRDERYPSYGRGERPSHYGNAVAGAGRGYGQGDRGYGRMYSDDMMRGPRGLRGGGRGGYR